MDELNKIKIAAVVGPTASGKTRLAVDLCRKLGAEAVSCDSMQIYKYMDIATAKPTADEMCGVVHHMLDFLEPGEKYSVASYCADAEKCIADISSRDKLPLIVGGTGLYYSSLVDGIVFADESNDLTVRTELEERCENEGIEVLHNELSKIDPESAQALHINNKGRIIRALEVYYKTGVTMSEQQRRSRQGQSRFDCTAICLDARDRQFLYDRIDRRVDLMIENGLVDEARRFLSGELGKTASQAIGYKELKPYIDGELSLDEAADNLKRATRRYAKRQLTWFRRDERINWLYIDEQPYDELVEKAFDIIERGLQDEKNKS